MRRVLGLVVFLCALAVSLFGAEVTFWFAGGDPQLDLPVVKKQVKAFEDATGIKVNLVVIPWAEDPHTKLDVAIMSGKAPDLAKVGSPREHALAWSKAIEPMDKYLPQDFLKNFSQSVLLGSTYKMDKPKEMSGKIVGIPYFCHTRVVLYRKDILAERGLPEPSISWTWNDFLEYARRLTFDRNGDGQVDVYGFGASAQYAYQLMIWVWQAGGRMIDEKGTPTINTELFHTGAKFFVDLFKTYKVVQPGGINANLADVRRQLVAGQVAMYIDTGDAGPALKKELGDKVGAVPLPINPETGKRTSYYGADVFVIPSNAKNKEGAAKLLMWLCSKENMLEYCNVAGFVPSRVDAAQEYVGEDQIMNAFAQQMSDSNPWVEHPEYSAFTRIIRAAIQDVLSDKLSLADGLKRAQQELETHLKEKGFVW
ncbi:ABC transporter substrate-binding protein [Pseudothermotoga sp. U03pept]|uniref:ABC transporter substrate-binding protein n=1 Tax=Pseudothermotoga sp. U03pept TaxID=3447012 RepID=UPI003EFD2453